jgi:hypothetical protein
MQSSVLLYRRERCPSCGRVVVVQLLHPIPVAVGSTVPYVCPYCRVAFNIRLDVDGVTA